MTLHHNLAQVVPLNSTLTNEQAESALAAMRAQLGRSRAAAEWSRLTHQQRAMLCYGAKLRPSTYAHLALEEMTDSEREAIRHALVEMKRGLRDFVATDRTEWRHAGQCTTYYRQTRKEEERREQQSRVKLAQQARQLNQKVSTINAKSPVSCS